MSKIEKLFLYIISTLFFISMFFMGFSSVCHAETTGSLPYVVPSMRDLNSAIPYDIMPNIDAELRSYYSLTDSDSILYFLNTWDSMSGSLGEYEWNAFSYVVNPSIPYGYSSSLDYLTTSVTVSGPSGTMDFKWDGRYRGPYTMSGSFSLLNVPTTDSISQGSFTRLYPFYLSGPDLYSYHIPDG